MKTFDAYEIVSLVYLCFHVDTSLLARLRNKSGLVDLKNVSVKVCWMKFKNRRIGVSSLTLSKRNNWVSCRYG
ncbi:MAG: hypothetical protein ACLTZT_03140 [Butyricimonas faecalis]